MALQAVTEGGKRKAPATATAALGGFYNPTTNPLPAGAVPWVLSQLPGATPDTSSGAAPDPGSGDGSGGGQGGAAAPAADAYMTNPGYLQALAAEQTGSQQADAALRAAQEQAIIGYGDPSLAAALGLNVDPNVAAAARQNYLAGNSTTARLDQQQGQNQQQNIHNEVSRGLLFSGDTGYQAGQIDRLHGNQMYDAQQALLNQNQQWLGQNMATKQQLRQSTVDALNGAYNTFVANPGLYAQPPPTTPTATPPQTAAPALGAGDFTAHASPSQVTAAFGGSRLGQRYQRNPGRGLVNQ